MNEHQATTNTGGTRPNETCNPRDLGEQIADMLGISPQTRQHIRNARIEVLKAVRSVIDARIDHLSRTDQKGTKLTVD